MSSARERRRRRRRHASRGRPYPERWDRAIAGVVILSGVSIAVAAPAEETSSSLLGSLQQSVNTNGGQGMKVGSAFIMPTFLVSEIFDTNVFASSKNAHSDFLTTFVPGIDIESDWPRNAFSLRAQGEFRRFADYGRESTDNASVAGTGRIDIAPNAYVLAGGSYQLLHEDRGALVPVNGITPTQYTVTSGKSSFVIEPAPMGIRLDATVDSYGYNDVALYGGPVIGESARDRVVYALSPQLSYQIVPEYNAFIRAVVNRREYNDTREPDGLDRSSGGYATDVGASFNLKGFATGEIYVGYLAQNYDAHAVHAISGADFGGNLAWHPTDDLALHFNVSRSVEESALLGSQGYLQTMVRLGVEQQVMRDLSVLGSLSYINANFAGISGSTDIYEMKLGTRYDLSDRLSAGLEYDIRYRSGGVALPSYTRQIVELSLRGKL
ncbi:MAG TPA: outer membrane beta-barrel protein [Stellaceae bacterium]|nr:outer membrane beta-barrel protein [Stellaceae bacterium]